MGGGGREWEETGGSGRKERIERGFLSCYITIDTCTYLEFLDFPHPRLLANVDAIFHLGFVVTAKDTGHVRAGQYASPLLDTLQHNLCVD